MTQLPRVESFKQKFVSCARTPENVATIVLDRPKVNALSLELIGEIEAAAEHLHADLPAAVVVWGGPRIFSAGADITQMGGSEAARRETKAFRQAFDALASLPRIVIAAINGYALGGGFELALACDFRIAGRNAHVGLPEIKLGLLPGAGGTQRLPRLVGSRRSMELILSGRHVSAPEAEAIGMVDRVVDDEDLLEAALNWATEFSQGPQTAQGVAKRLITAAADTELGAGLDDEAAAVIDLFDSEDALAGIHSFLEGRRSQGGL